MGLFDTHCHLDLEVFGDANQDVLERARAAGVRMFIVPGVVQAGWAGLVDLCSRESGLYPAPGLHPMYLRYHKPYHFEQLEELVRSTRVIGLGEIGLDYHIKGLDKQNQQKLFEQQLDLAQREQLPVCLHVRKAHDQVLATMRRRGFKQGGIVHAFNGSYQQAEQYIKLGFGIGVGGTVTYARARKIRRVAAVLPIEFLVLETDAPDIPPASHHGEVNLPEYLPEIVAALAELRNVTVDSVADNTTANAKRIFGL